MTGSIKKFINMLLPPQTTRRTWAGRFARKIKILGRKHPDVSYHEWTERSEPFLWSPVEELEYQPLISIVVPVYNAPAKYLMPMVYSVVAQQYYDNWELILVNASSEDKPRLLTEQCADIDVRIKVVEVSGNLGIAGNTDLGIKSANGDYIGLLDHDDTLAPMALHEIARVLQHKPRPRLIYSDEDKISDNGDYRYDPFFKPDWSPFLFRHVNYLNHFTVIDKKLIDEVGGYRKEFEGAQDYDFFLRLTDENPKITHVPKILYHWRAAIGSTAHNFEAKADVRDAGVEALNDHLKRHKQAGKVGHLAKQPGFYTIDYDCADDTKLAVVLLQSPVVGQYRDLIKLLIKSLKTTSLDTEIFIASGQEKKVTDKLSVRLVEASSSTNFIDEVLAQTTANVFIILNSAFIPLRADWAERLAGLVSQMPNVAVASPLIVDKTGGIIIDAGFVEAQEQSIALFQWMPIKGNSYLGNSAWGRNIDRTSNRINVMRREVLEKYFTPDYPKLNQGKGVYNKLKEHNLEVIVDTATKVDYSGDFQPANQKSRFYNPNLVDLRKGLSLPKTINVPPEAAE